MRIGKAKIGQHQDPALRVVLNGFGRHPVMHGLLCIVDQVGQQGPLRGQMQAWAVRQRGEPVAQAVSSSPQPCSHARCIFKFVARDEFQHDGHHTAEHLERCWGRGCRSGDLVIARQVDQPGPPIDAGSISLGHVFRQEKMPQRFEGLVHRAKRGFGLAQAKTLQFAIAVAQIAEGVVIEPAPDMQTVFFDPLAMGGVTAAGPFAAQPPAKLIDGDVKPVLPVGQPGQGEKRRDRSDATADGQNSRLLVRNHCNPIVKYLSLMGIFSCRIRDMPSQPTTEQGECSNFMERSRQDFRSHI
jgi:hypothetical protein